MYLLGFVLIFWYLEETVSQSNVYWSAIAGSQDGTRYSPLEDINLQNIKSLSLAWRYTMPADSIKPGQTSAVPIVVDDGNGGSVLVYSTPMNQVIGLNPTNGQLKWIWSEMKMPLINNRGLSHWINPALENGDMCKSTVYLGTGIEMKIVALDADTGKLCPQFGINGTIQVNDTAPLVAEEWYLKSPPVVVNGVIAASPAIRDNWRRNMTSGATWAFDAATGARLWKWSAIPTPDDTFAYSTWLNGTESSGGGNTWATMTGDEKTNSILLTVGSASPDFYGGERPGDNLYTGCIVNLDASTGKIKWHFQTVRHDIWDYDGGAQPAITNINGQRVVVFATKTAMLWILDIETGQPIYGYENRSVPETFLPGEWTSKTQPFPIPSDLILSSTQFTESDIWGRNETELGYCLNFYRNLTGHQEGRIYTPISLNGTVLNPGYGGGVNYDGCAVDPTQGVAVCSINHVIHFVKMYLPGTPFDSWCSVKKPQEFSPYTYCDTVFMNPSTALLCVKPPWTTLMMINISNPKVMWSRPIGYIPGLNETWGVYYQRGGAIMTKSGLILITGTDDSNLWAIDLSNGDTVWKYQFPKQYLISPMTYRVDNRQYIVINGDAGTIYGFAIETPDNSIWWIGFTAVGAVLLVIVVTAVVIERRRHHLQYLEIK